MTQRKKRLIGSWVLFASNRNHWVDFDKKEMYANDINRSQIANIDREPGSLKQNQYPLPHGTIH